MCLPALYSLVRPVLSTWQSPSMDRSLLLAPEKAGISSFQPSTTVCFISFFRPLICSFQLSHFLNICFFVFTFSLGEGPTLLCGQSYPNSKYLFWSFRHVRGQWKKKFILFSREKESLHLFGTFQGNSIKCIFGKLSARTDVCKNKVLFGSSFGKRWGFQRGLGSLSIDCAFNSSTLCLHVADSLQSGAHKQVSDKSRDVQNSLSGAILGENLWWWNRISGENIPLLVQSCHSTRNSLIWTQRHFEGKLLF